MELHISVDRERAHTMRLRVLSGVAWSSADELFRQVGLVPGMKCLDVRCGAGEVTLPMAQAGATDGLVVGVDPEERLIARARKAAVR
jgi:2-polyprenyl-3-methyl-5-hydroxy-6-metoxy-1,4-benzoquinol methylase